MTITINNTLYEITKVSLSPKTKMIVSDGKITIPFERIKEGWITEHHSIEDPIFPDEDIFELIRVLDGLLVTQKN